MILKMASVRSITKLFLEHLKFFFDWYFTWDINILLPMVWKNRIEVDQYGLLSENLCSRHTILQWRKQAFPQKVTLQIRETEVWSKWSPKIWCDLWYLLLPYYFNTCYSPIDLWETHMLISPFAKRKLLLCRKPRGWFCQAHYSRTCYTVVLLPHEA